MIHHEVPNLPLDHLYYSWGSCTVDHRLVMAGLAINSQGPQELEPVPLTDLLHPPLDLFLLGDGARDRVFSAYGPFDPSTSDRWRMVLSSMPVGERSAHDVYTAQEAAIVRSMPLLAVFSEVAGTLPHFEELLYRKTIQALGETVVDLTAQRMVWREQATDFARRVRRDLTSTFSPPPYTGPPVPDVD